MLDDLQGNILKGHGRDHTAQLFLQFHDAKQGRAFLSALATQVKSASQQLHEAEIYRETKVPAGAFVVCFLSHAGYRALEVDERQIPDSTAFHEGMRGRAGDLGDRPEDDWDQLFEQQIHALVLIADSSAAQTRQHLWQLRRLARQHAVCEIGIEIGKAIKNHHDRNIEHFGYVDGISVPVMLTEDLPDKRGRWTPVAPLGLALVHDPGGQDAFSFGSYFVFRKLEQNVRAFKQAEEKLAEALALKDHELAGALVIGRFEDGTPVVISSDDGLSPESPENNFNYGDDQQGRHCPFHAHVRKVNPRGESGKIDEHTHLLVRRGITYGERTDDPNDEDADSRDRPTGGIGLLFMAYHSSIEKGFEHVQKAWANDPGYARPNTGPDPLISWRKLVEWQEEHRFGWQARWGTDEAPKDELFSIEQLVTPKGGEYFFAPSISFLKSLDSKEQ
ncbi:MAG TPA: Dyp-type peroxidase [Roseiflexaceae bacterium]|nr:Dyp-type peroxidase [Roseiflexaceae bacterium]